MNDKIEPFEASTFFIAVVALSIATSPISFTLGTYGEVFYRELLTVWFVSLAAFFANLVVGQTKEGEKYFTWWGSALLFIPSVLLFSEVLGIAKFPMLILSLEWILLLGSIPYIGFILLHVAVPDAIEFQTQRLNRYLILIVVSINIASFLVGYFNAYFFECDDFIRSGDQMPKGCWTNI